MRVATFNVQNRYLQDNNLSELVYNDLLYKTIKNNKIDILGVQELTYNTRKFLSNNFNLYGRGRIPIFKKNKYNEYNSIITNLDVLKTTTRYLPFIESIIPRILTVSIVKYNDMDIRIINTHLSLYKYHNLKIKQLNKIINIVKQKDMPTIIMGDLNLRKNANEVLYFKKELEKYNIYMVNNSKNTYKNNILDYIFVSDIFKVNKISVIKTNISDHNMLVVDLEIKKV